MLKVRSLIVASKGAVAGTVTGAVVVLGTQSTAVAQDPFPFTAAARSTAASTAPTNLPPFPEAATTVTTPPPFPEVSTTAAAPTPLPPFPEASTTVVPSSVVNPIETNPIDVTPVEPSQVEPSQTIAVQSTPTRVSYPPFPETNPLGVNRDSASEPANIEAIEPERLELDPVESREFEPHVSASASAPPAPDSTVLVDDIAKTTKVAAIPALEPAPSPPQAQQPLAVNPIRQSFQATTSPTIAHRTTKAPKAAEAIASATPLESSSTTEAAREATVLEVNTADEQPESAVARVWARIGAASRIAPESTESAVMADSSLNESGSNEPGTAIAVIPAQRPAATVETHLPQATHAASLTPRIRKDPSPSSAQLLAQTETQAEETTAPEASLELPAPVPVEDNELPQTEAVELELIEPEAAESGTLEAVAEEEPLDEIVNPGETALPAKPATLDQLPAQAQSADVLIETPSGLRQEVPPPDFLNPSGNPMLFPTEADEVAIDITQPITLEQALALARRNNQDLQSARLDLERSYAVLKEARAGLWPSVDGTTTLSRTNSASTEISNARAGALSTALGNEATTDTFNAELSVTYDIFDGGQTSAEIRSAKHSLRFSQLEVEELTEEVHLAATQDYYSLQEADQQVGIEIAAVDQAQQTLRDAKLLLDAGLGTRFDVIRAEVELANSSQALTQAQANQAIARRQLVRTLGLGQQVEVTTADEVVPVLAWELPLEETIVLAYRNRAELEQRTIEREIEEEQRQIALATTRPQLNVFARYNILDILSDDIDGSSGYSIGAQVTWNFFDGGAARARKRQAEIDLELAEVAFEQERNTIRLEVEDAYYNFIANEKNIKTATAAVELAKESLRLARLRFQAGVGTQTDVIDAQTELTRSKGNLLTAIITYNNSIASLRRAVSNTPDRRLFDLP